MVTICYLLKDGKYASMIDNNLNQSKRLEKLNETAQKELSILSNDRNIFSIEKLDSNKKLIETNQFNKVSIIMFLIND